MREPDGAVTYVGRTAYRVREGEAKKEMHVLQRTRDAKLDEFDIHTLLTY